MFPTLVLLSLVQQLALSQYEVVRVDPFRHVSHTLHVYTVTTCDWDTMTLTCPLGTKISIQHVQYSETNSSCSSLPSSPSSSSSSSLRPSTCSTVTSPIRRLEAECQGRESCSLLVSTQTLLPSDLSDGDLCHDPDIRRRLAVSFQCRPSSLRTKLTCPKSDIKLSCPVSGSRLLLMSSTVTRDLLSVSHYCGHQLTYDAAQDKCRDFCSNTTLTRHAVDTCHGKKSCHVSMSGLGHVVLVRTVYSCVPPGVINLMSLVPTTTSTTSTTTTPTTTVVTTTTTTTIITTTSTIQTTSSSSKAPTKTSTIENIQNDQVVNGSKQTDGLTTVASAETNQDANDARKDKEFMSQDVSQYSSVISGDMNLDILPLEQDISDTDGHRDPSFMKAHFTSVLVVGLCCVLTVILVSVILAVTVRLLSRAGAGAEDTDSTYYPASDSVDTLVTVTTSECDYDSVQTRPSPRHGVSSIACEAPVVSPHQLSVTPVYCTVGRKIKPPTPTLAEENYLVNSITQRGSGGVEERRPGDLVTFQSEYF